MYMPSCDDNTKFLAAFAAFKDPFLGVFKSNFNAIVYCTEIFLIVINSKNSF